MKSKLVGLLMCCFIILAAVLVACAPAAAPATEAKQVGTTPTIDASAGAKGLFTASEADDALHTKDGTIYEWWYLDAAFDNGYSMSTSWQVVTPEFIGNDNTTHLIQFAIYDPDGKKTSVDVPFDVKDTTISTTTCDVKMGTNHLKGNIKTYDMEFKDKDLGGKLTFVSVAESFRNPPDGLSYFTKQPDRLDDSSTQGYCNGNTNSEWEGDSCKRYWLS